MEIIDRLHDHDHQRGALGELARAFRDGAVGYYRIPPETRDALPSMIADIMREAMAAGKKRTVMQAAKVMLAIEEANRRLAAGGSADGVQQTVNVTVQFDDRG